MAARHQDSFEILSKKFGFDRISQVFGDVQKILNYQSFPPPPLLPLKGGGQAVGGGTSFPVLYPLANLGTQGATVTINLGKPDAHYQKLILTDPGSEITILFKDLIKTRAIMFTLDVTIATPTLPPLVWPDNLFNLPVLPTDEDSRYILTIIGFRDDAEERYYVVNSAVGSVPVGTDFSINYIIDGGGNPIPIGSKGGEWLHFNAEVLDWTISEQLNVCSVDVEVRISRFPNFPVSFDMSTPASMSMIAANKAKGDITGWTRTDINGGDYDGGEFVEFQLIAASNPARRIEIALHCRRV